MKLFGLGKQTDTPAVSVLVPVYNVEKYLPACLDSLAAQKLKSIEFICINDGSTDGSLDVLERYANEDSRFRIIDKPNSGYGASMNCGLDAARGKYIGIVESDDFASPDMFKKLYSFARRHDCDIVKSNYFEYDGEDHYLEPFVGHPYKKVFNPRDMHSAVRVLPIIWAAIYRRSMLLESGIRFNETPGASFQDTSFVFRCWVASNRVALLKDAFLHYRINRDESSVKSSAKVFEVCGEYAMSEAFLRERPERMKDFGSLLNAMKFDTYRWNFNRISPECRTSFCVRWAEEYAKADGEGYLIESYFSPSDWLLVKALMADARAFAESHQIL